MPPMSFIAELMATNSATGTTTNQPATRGMPPHATNSDSSETSDPTEPEKENAKLINIKELVARNAAKNPNSSAKSRQQLLELITKKGSANAATDSANATPSSTAPSSSSSTPKTSSPSSHSVAASVSEPLRTRSISPKATKAKKRRDDPALQALLANRPRAVVTSSPTVNESKKLAISEMVAKRVAPRSNPEEDTIVQPRTGRKNAIAEKLAKRGSTSNTNATPATTSDKTNVLAEMLSKRQVNPSKTEVTQPQSTDPKSKKQAEIVVKRGGAARSSSTETPPTSGRNAVAEMLSKRTADPVEGGARPNPLAEMLAKRGAASSEKTAANPLAEKRGAASSEKTAANPLAEMLAKRGAASGEKPAANPLTEMLAKRGAASAEKPAANPLAEMLAMRGAASGEKPAANPLAEMLAKRQAPSTASSTEAPSEKAADPAPEDVDEHANTPLRDHPKYATYFKMLKIGQPSDVVRHRMRREGVDVAILDCDPAKPLPKETPAESAVDDKDPAYVEALKTYNAKMPKYQQMMKMGLPRGAVEHKMQMEGVDLAWLDAPPQPPKKAIATGPTEAEIAAHKEKYHQYFQMLKMGLPRGAVEHKMLMAGVDPRELDGPIVAGSSAAPTSAAPAAKAGLPPAPSIKKAQSIRKKLHWEVKRQESRNSQRESLWNLTILGDDTALGHVAVSQESKELLEKLFVKDMTAKAAEPSAAAGKKGAKPAKKQVMYLIDMKKSQNISITLARIKLTYVELKREILALNPTVLSTAQLQSLMDMWPDQTEQVAIDNFHGDDSVIGAAEKFLVEVRNIPRFKEKLGCLVFKQEFPTRVHEIRESINLVIRGVNQVCCSSALQQLFIYILRTGNLLNFGTDDSSAVSVGGFSLNSLVKLSQTKAFTGGLTFLQYIVQCIERDIPQLARFPQQINLIQKCSKVAISSLFAEKRALEEGLKSLNHEAKAVVPAGGDADAELGASILANFATEVEMELEALQALLDQMMECKGRFLEYFEEEETSEELDVLLSHIASFTLDFEREHGKHLEQLDKARLQEQQRQDQEAKKQKLQHAKSSRHSLPENPLQLHHSKLRSRQSHGHGHLQAHGHSHPHAVALKHASKPQDNQSQENQDPKSNSNYFPQFVVDRLKRQASTESAGSNSALRSGSTRASDDRATFAV